MSHGGAITQEIKFKKIYQWKDKIGRNIGPCWGTKPAPLVTAIYTQSESHQRHLCQPFLVRTLAQLHGLLTFGNEWSIPAQGRVFTRGGVTTKKRLRLIRKEALSAVHWWLLHWSTAGPTHTTAAAAWGLHGAVGRTETLAYIHWGHHQLVDVQLQVKQEKKKMRRERICTPSPLIKNPSIAS